MKKIKLNVQTLTQENFNQFGDVIETQGHDFDVINSGFANKYANLAQIDTSYENGKTAIHIFIAKKRPMPLQIDMLEMHPFFSQCFIPRSDKAFIIVVAPPAKEPNLEQISAFISDGQQGVNFARGVWHFPLISLEDDAQFITIDRHYDKSIDSMEQCNIVNIDSFNITVDIGQ
jgi:ureidoglycolate lyase